MTNTNQKRNRVCRVNLSSLQIHCDINRICFPGSLTDSALFASACRQALAGQWSSSVPSTANKKFFEMTEKHVQVANCLDNQKKMNRIDLNHPEGLSMLVYTGVAVLLPVLHLALSASAARECPCDRTGAPAIKLAKELPLLPLISS